MPLNKETETMLANIFCYCRKKNIVMVNEKDYKQVKCF